MQEDESTLLNEGNENFEIDMSLSTFTTMVRVLYVVDLSKNAVYLV